MKVAYVLDTYPSLSETFIRREAEACRQRDMELTICALRGEPEGGESDVFRPSPTRWILALASPAAWRALSYAFRFPGTCRQRLGIISRWPTAVQWAMALKARNIEHLHAHFAFAPADVVAMMSQLMNCSYSLSVHARDIYTQPDAVLQYRLDGAGFVSVCTHHGMETVERRCPTLRDRLRFIPHGVDAGNPAAPWAAHVHPPVILSVARLVPKKGLSYLVEACNLLVEREVGFRCVIVGDGPEYEKLEAQICSLALDEYVQLAGFRRHDDLRKFYTEASVCVVPSVVAADGDRDGLPNVLLEAQAAGRPVIGTTASAAGEWIGDGENGFLLPPGDAVALADCLEKALKSETQLRRMGTVGRERIEESFTAAPGIDLLVCEFRQAAIKEEST